MPALQPGATITLRGELIEFRTRTEDGWGTGSMRVAGADGAPATVALTGKLLGARPGDALEVVGVWVDHKSFGRQFKVTSTVISAPETIDGVTAWLASTLPGVGHKRARLLVEHFGGVTQLWHAIEHAPQQLADLQGIGESMAQQIHDVYMRARGSRDHMVALRGWGLTDNQIQKCLEAWKTLDAVVKRIRQNPYELSRHVHGFGFKRADEVARLAGIAHNAPERIEAGIVHTLETATSEGHCWLYGGALQRIAADEILNVTRDDVARGIVAASRLKMILRRGKRIYCARMEVAEAITARSVLHMLAVLPMPNRPAPANDNGNSSNSSTEGGNPTWH